MTGQPPPAREDLLHEWFVRGLAGDGAAYEAFLGRLAAHLRSYYRRRLLAMPDQVEDLVQEALIAVHNQRHTYDPARPLTAWAHTIAKYKLVDFLRAHARGGALDDPLDDESTLFAASDHDAADAKRDLAKLLAQLPDRQRLPIVHVKIEGRSVRECAELTGLSEPAVKIGIHRGLKALARIIGNRR